MKHEPENLTLAHEETPASRTDKGVGSGRLVRVRRARLKMAIVGQWMRWEIGTLVKARKQADGDYFIKRARRIDPNVHCVNEMAGVPGYLLKFEAHSNIADEGRR